MELNQIGAMLGETTDELQKIPEGKKGLCGSSTIKLLKLALIKLRE